MGTYQVSGDSFHLVVQKYFSVPINLGFRLSQKRTILEYLFYYNLNKVYNNISRQPVFCK